ncbi:MAG: anti-sigma factor antagonist [Clostridia bacterium]|nr:anti-sigma factor antagonist [Clostridia bacterium]
MEYKVNETATGKEIAIQGSFTFRDHDRFFEVVSLIKSSKDKKMTFDLSQCDFIDSAALGMFVIASDEAAAKDMTLVIRAVTGKVKDVMFAARFDNLYTFED